MMPLRISSPASLLFLYLASFTIVCADRTASATASLAGNAVASVAVNDGGAGYLRVPLITFSGGGGTGATAVAVVENGAVKSIAVTSGGSGYTNAPAVAVAAPASFLEDGLVLFYPFNGNLLDATSSGNNGTSTQPIYVDDRFSRAKSAFFLTGAGNYVQALDHLPESESITVSFWMTLDHWGDFQAVFFEGDDGPGHDLVGVFYGGFHFGTKLDNELFQPNWFPPVNTWVHYVCVADAITHQKELWINGQKVKSAVFTAGANAGYHAQFNLGRRPGGYNDWYLRAAIDDVRVYNRGLSAAEVAAMYVTESGRPEGVTIDVDAVRVTMNVVPGNRYQLEASSDLLIWLPVGDAFLADSATVSQTFSVTPGTRYWRLVPLP
ncbi:MAG TPA: LamG domain-containing protein [Candidatus Limnocylindria bacterium]|nr:LamG domain-containing protein [Candidatus Limnocylindria bacterium]